MAASRAPMTKVGEAGGKVRGLTEPPHRNAAYALGCEQRPDCLDLLCGKCALGEAEQKAAAADEERDRGWGIGRDILPADGDVDAAGGVADADVVQNECDIARMLAAAKPADRAHQRHEYENQQK